jgi:hypothetical protein
MTLVVSVESAGARVLSAGVCAEETIAVNDCAEKRIAATAAAVLI